MGYANTLYELLNIELLDNTDDDQLFYTKLYLNEKIRNSLNIKLDVKAEIFQNLFGAKGILIFNYFEYFLFIKCNVFKVCVKIFEKRIKKKVIIKNVCK